MWFDNDPRTTLAVKVQKASAYYQQKFGRLPDLCLVHPSMLVNSPLEERDRQVTIRSYQPVLPGHLWIGIEEQNS
jgi:hypothetical protein